MSSFSTKTLQDLIYIGCTFLNIFLMESVFHFRASILVYVQLFMECNMTRPFRYKMILITENNIIMFITREVYLRRSLLSLFINPDTAKAA